MRIAYVEDNPTNLALVERVALMGKHQIISYTEGEIAVQELLRETFDLILMDVELAGEMNGLDVVRNLRSNGLKTPIVAVTAYAMQGDLDRCIEAGCNDYLSKPLPIPALVALLARYQDMVLSVVPVVEAVKVETAPVEPARPVPAATASPEPVKSVESQKPETSPIDVVKPTEPIKVEAPKVEPTPTDVVKPTEPVQVEAPKTEPAPTDVVRPVEPVKVEAPKIEPTPTDVVKPTEPVKVEAPKIEPTGPSSTAESVKPGIPHLAEPAANTPAVQVVPDADKPQDHLKNEAAKSDGATGTVALTGSTAPSTGNTPKAADAPSEEAKPLPQIPNS
jgi:CheY-like chemotaxis protein